MKIGKAGGVPLLYFFYLYFFIIFFCVLKKNRITLIIAKINY